jgi:hypothetical protein
MADTTTDRPGAARTEPPTDAPGGALSPGSEISPDTHVGSRIERLIAEAAAEPSDPDPLALVRGNRVTTAADME